MGKLAIWADLFLGVPVVLIQLIADNKPLERIKMPYIKKEDRERFDDLFRDLLPENAGELNYVISVLCNEYLHSRGIRYQNINEVIGVLECMKLEFYRRVASPYEDTKIEENGDVYL